MAGARGLVRPRCRTPGALRRSAVNRLVCSFLFHVGGDRAISPRRRGSSRKSGGFPDRHNARTTGLVPGLRAAMRILRVESPYSGMAHSVRPPHLSDRPACRAEPNSDRRGGHVEVVHAGAAQRVGDSIHQRWRRPDCSGFADPFHTQYICRAGHWTIDNNDRTHQISARHHVVHEAAGQQLPGVWFITAVLAEHLAGALHHPP